MGDFSSVQNLLKYADTESFPILLQEHCKNLVEHINSLLKPTETEHAIKLDSIAREINFYNLDFTNQIKLLPNASEQIESFVGKVIHNQSDERRKSLGDLYCLWVIRKLYPNEEDHETYSSTHAVSPAKAYAHALVYMPEKLGLSGVVNFLIETLKEMSDQEKRILLRELVVNEESREALQTLIKDLNRLCPAKQ